MSPADLISSLRAAGDPLHLLAADALVAECAEVDRLRAGALLFEAVARLCTVQRVLAIAAPGIFPQVPHPVGPVVSSRPFLRIGIPRVFVLPGFGACAHRPCIAAVPAKTISVEAAALYCISGAPGAGDQLFPRSTVFISEQQCSYSASQRHLQKLALLGTGGAP